MTDATATTEATETVKVILPNRSEKTLDVPTGTPAEVIIRTLQAQGNAALIGVLDKEETGKDGARTIKMRSNAQTKG